jgi:hypothetical protein
MRRGSRCSDEGVGVRANGAVCQKDFGVILLTPLTNSMTCIGLHLHFDQCSEPL